MDGSNYVGPAGGGGYVAIVNGVPVGGGPFPTQAQAEQAYNANGGPTGPSGGGSPTGTPTPSTETGYRTDLAGQSDALRQAGYGGPWDAASVQAAYARTYGGGNAGPPTGAYGAGAYGADPNGTMYFNQGAGQLALGQAQLAAQTAYQNALIKGQSDTLAFQEAQQAWTQTMQAAQLTGVYNGSSTLDAQRLQEQKLLDAQNYGLSQGNLMGTYNGAPTLAGQLQAAQLSGMYNGSPTMAMQAQNNQEALGYLGLMKGMSGPANAFDYAHALTGTPGGLADIVRAAGGAYQLPAFGGGGDQAVAPLSIQSMIADVGQYSPTAGGAAIGQQQAMAPPAYGQGPAVAGGDAVIYNGGRDPNRVVPAGWTPPPPVSGVPAPPAQPTPPGYGGGLGDPGLPAWMGGSGSPPAAPSAPAPGMPSRGPALPVRSSFPDQPLGRLGMQAPPPMFGTSPGLGGAPPAMAHDPLGPPLPPAQPPHMPYDPYFNGAPGLPPPQPPHMPYDPTFNGGGGLPPARPPYVAHDPLGPGLPPPQPPHMPYDPTFNGGRAAPPGASGQGLSGISLHSGPVYASPSWYDQPANQSYNGMPLSNPYTTGEATPPPTAVPPAAGGSIGQLATTAPPSTGGTTPQQANPSNPSGGYIPSYGKLPPPNQISPNFWNNATPSQMQLLMGAYSSGQGGQIPYLPADVTAMYQQSLRGYGGPQSASVGF